MTTVTLTTSGDTYVIDVAFTPTAVEVNVETGPRGPAGPPGADGVAGPPGANAETVILTLAEYLVLTPEQQMDGRWYVVPKTA